MSSKPVKHLVNKFEMNFSSLQEHFALTFMQQEWRSLENGETKTKILYYYGDGIYFIRKVYQTSMVFVW